MEIEWVNGNILNVPAEAIVCPTRSDFVHSGSGVEAAVYQAAGKGLEEERLKTAPHIDAGGICVTHAYALKQCNKTTQYIIHVVGTSIKGKHLADVFAVYAQCYRNILYSSWDYHWSSVAIPVLGGSGSRIEYMDALKMAYSMLSSLRLDDKIRQRVKTVYLVTHLVHGEGYWEDVSNFFGTQEPRKHFGTDQCIIDDRAKLYNEIHFNEEEMYRDEDPVVLAWCQAKESRNSNKLDMSVFSQVWLALLQQPKFKSYLNSSKVERESGIPRNNYNRILNGNRDPTRNEIIALSVMIHLKAHQIDRLLDTIRAAHLDPSSSEDREIFLILDHKVKPYVGQIKVRKKAEKD